MCLYPKDNFCRIHTKPVSQFLRTIYHITPIRFFCYAKVYDTGGYINFTNNDAFHDIRFNELHNISSYIMNTGTYIMSDFNPSRIIELGEQHDIYNAVGQFHRQDDFTEVTVFGLNSQTKEHSSFFLNHIDFLASFSKKFKHEFQQPIDFASKSPLPVPKNLFLRKTYSHFNIPPEDMLNVFIHPPEATHKLSKRELECLQLLLLGNKRKEIAAQIGISLSSVGTYINRLLAKLNFSNKSELVDYAWEVGLIKSDSILAPSHSQPAYAMTEDK